VRRHRIQDTEGLDQSSLHGDLFGTNSFTNTPELGPVDNDLLPHPSFPTPE